MLVHRLLSAGNLKIAGSGKLVEHVGIESIPCALMPEMANLDLDGDIAAFICPAPFGDAEVEKKEFRHLLISRDLWNGPSG